MATKGEGKKKAELFPTSSSFTISSFKRRKLQYLINLILQRASKPKGSVINTLLQWWFFSQTMMFEAWWLETGYGILTDCRRSRVRDSDDRSWCRRNKVHAEHDRGAGATRWTTRSTCTSWYSSPANNMPCMNSRKDQPHQRHRNQVGQSQLYHRRNTIASIN